MRADRQTYTLIAMLRTPPEGGRSNNAVGGADEQLAQCTARIIILTKMWANAQRDGRPAEHRWRPLFNAAKFG